MQTALRLSTRRPSPFFTAARAAFPITKSISSSYVQQSRPAATSTLSAKEAQALLDSQRRVRPVAPHIFIYEPQLTWGLSGASRVGGAILSGGVYLYALAYAIAPYVGWHMETAAVAAAFGSLPLVAKLGLKATVATPFVFHCLNGTRHLWWDTGKALSMKGVYGTGYTVLGLTGVCTAALFFL